MSTVIRFTNIQKIFGETAVLSNISFEVKHKEIVGLLGPSGSGKTTIINIMIGRYAKTSGEVSLFGNDVKELTYNNMSRIGVLYDDLGLYEKLTVYDNLYIYSKIFNINNIEIDAALKKVGLEGQEKKIVNKLSKGMKQRLALARTILHKPRLLVLDEPTSGLDPVNADRIHKILLRLRNEGTTIFLTTHDMEEATKLCDNVILMNNGEIIEKGTVYDICKKHDLENKIIVTLKDKTVLTLQNNNKNAGKLYCLLKNEDIASIRTSEPNLETVFIERTGRRFI